MHVVTFYSYKGGVGRTMALVNTAALLAKRGHKVLIVDFDLEAPGIATYRPFNSLAGKKGVVDYVTEYISTNSSSKVTDFIVECRLGEAPVWVMPAGARNRDYSFKLNSIDWQGLYTLRKGYLFFEDLKQQWEREGFKYVLIDSRTGYTDVGGICTRQLPHAVVLMFLPNEQNLFGIESVVREIDEEPTRLSNKIIKHFCASNVPELDDEDHILDKKLQDAQSRLHYSETPVLIHHYNSLTLLEQSVFVIDRPDSKLTREYQSLVTTIVRSNLEDRDGAFATLLKIRDDLRKQDDEDDALNIRTQLDDIKGLHNKDPDIAWVMANIYNLIGDLDAEAEALNIAIQKKPIEMRVRRRRAAISVLQDREQDALQDLRTVIASASTTGLELLASAELLRELDQNWVRFISEAPSLEKLAGSERRRLITILMSDTKGVELAVELARALPVSLDKAGNEEQNVQLVLGLIHLRRFDEAKSILVKNREDVFSADEVVSFNYAMAEWGKDGVAPKEIFRHAIERILEGEYCDTNRFQCLALAFFSVGDVEAAKEALAKAEYFNDDIGRTFSCWRYLEVTRLEMQEDLKNMSLMFEGAPIKPAVFELSPNSANK